MSDGVEFGRKLGNWTPETDLSLNKACESVYWGARATIETYPAIHSAHEGLALILHRLDVLKLCVWLKPEDRELSILRIQAVQLAAITLRFIAEVCTEEGYQK